MIITPHPRIAVQEQIQEVKKEIATHEKSIASWQERIQHAPTAKRGRARCVAWVQQISSRNDQLNRAQAKLEKLQQTLLSFNTIEELFPVQRGRGLHEVIIIQDIDGLLINHHHQLAQAIKV